MTEQGTDLSELIDRVCGQLKLEAAYAQQLAAGLHARETSSREEFEELGGRCDSLSLDGYAAAQELMAAGIHDWVYAVKASNEVGYWANEAAGQARSAAASASPTEIRGMSESAVHALDNAVSSINGA